jgi:acetoacetate decarboxylase
MQAKDSQAEANPTLWTDARVLAVEVPVAAGAAAALLPAALEMTDPPTATLFVADYPKTLFGSVYREAAVLLHARDERGPAVHCPWMVVDDDTALILGRELLGFPKKMADIRLEVSDDRAVGTVARKGVEILRIEAQVGAAEAQPAPLFARRMVNVIGTPVTGMKLVDLAPTFERIHDSRRAEAKVSLSSSERDPLGELEPAPSAVGRLLTLDFGSAGERGPGPQLIGDADAAWLGRRLYPRAL